MEKEMLELIKQHNLIMVKLQDQLDEHRKRINELSQNLIDLLDILANLTKLNK